MRIFTRMIKVISLMSYCTLLYIIALVDCAESGRWSFVSLVSAILVALGDWSLAILVALGDWSLAVPVSLILLLMKTCQKKKIHSMIARMLMLVLR